MVTKKQEEQRHPSYREVQNSINELSRLMQYKSIKVNDTVIMHFNNLLKLLQFMINQDDKPESGMLEVMVMWAMRQITNNYTGQALTPEFLEQMVIDKVDFILRTSKDYQRDTLANTIVLNQLERTMDVRVLESEIKIQNELDITVKELINYNRMHHEHRINQLRGD